MNLTVKFVSLIQNQDQYRVAIGTFEGKEVTWKIADDKKYRSSDSAAFKATQIASKLGLPYVSLRNTVIVVGRSGEQTFCGYRLIPCGYNVSMKKLESTDGCEDTNDLSVAQRAAANRAVQINQTFLAPRIES